MPGCHDVPPKRPIRLSGGYSPKRVSSRSTHIRFLPAQTPPRFHLSRTRTRRSPIVSTRLDPLCLTRIANPCGSETCRRSKPFHSFERNKLQAPSRSPPFGINRTISAPSIGFEPTVAGTPWSPFSAEDIHITALTSLNFPSALLQNGRLGSSYRPSMKEICRKKNKDRSSQVRQHQVLVQRVLRAGYQ